jgi:hypothetical protein
VIVFIVAWVLRRVFDPGGRIGTTLAVVGMGALAVWAIDEVVRGVNPFRRILGGAVLVGLVLDLV